MLLKKSLRTLCQSYLDKNIRNAEAAIADAREAAQNETKSSAGDKYETAREMMQQEIDLNTTRLQQLKQQQNVLARIDVDADTDVVVPGSIVLTTQGNYYIAVGAGKLIVDGIIYYAISLQSPIGQQLKGKKTGDVFTVNQQTHTIIQVS
jgi:transcription elongation GreA/GreB family factor